MKRFFMVLMLCLVSIVSFVSCDSKEEKITKNYVVNEVWRSDMIDANYYGGEVIDYSIKNFNDIPIDTIFEWQVFEAYDLALAKDSYERHKESLERMKQRRLISKNDIDRQVEMIQNDSLNYTLCLEYFDYLKEENKVRAVGYEFDIFERIKISGNKQESYRHRVIYIQENGDVFYCGIRLWNEQLRYYNTDL